MASVTYRKVGDVWYVRFTEYGRKEATRRFPGTLQERTIQQKVGWFKEQIALGRYNPWDQKEKYYEDTLTLEELIDMYCSENYRSGNWTERTKQTNRDRLKIPLEELLNDRIVKISEKDFQKALNAHQVSSYTRKGHKESFNTFLGWLHANDYAERYKVELPISDKIANRNQKQIKYLTYQQLTDICRAHRWEKSQFKRFGYVRDSFDPDFWPDAWWFMFWQVLRKEELPRLCKKDILANGTKLRVAGKSRSINVIPLVPPARKILAKYTPDLMPSDHLFTSSSNRLYKQFRSACRLALGPDESSGLHQLRHGGAVHYFTLGKKIQFVSKILRHRSVKVTYEVYGDVIPEGVSREFDDVEDKPAF